MTDKVCKCCGQSLPDDLNLAVPLSTMQRELVAAVWRRGKNGIAPRELFDVLYGNDPNGGPENGINAVSSRICQLNLRLKTVGKQIKGSRTGRGADCRYVFQDVAMMLP